MTKPPLPIWVTAANDALFTEPASIPVRTDGFRRKVRIRNGIEYAAGGIVLVPISIGSLAAGAIGEWAFAVALALLALGVVAVLRNLRAHAGDIEPRPEEPCLAHLRRQYRRQRDALQSVPRWYVAPFVPGLALLYATVAWNTAETIGWERALEGIALPVLGTIAFGIFVIVLNRWTAGVIECKLAALDELD